MENENRPSVVISESTNSSSASPDKAKSGASRGPDRIRARIADVKKRGVKPGSTRGAYKKGDAVPTPAAEHRPVSGLFTPENTIRVLRAPFLLAAVKAKNEFLALDPEEEKELAITGVPCLNEWVTVEPKWVALGMFSLSFTSVVVSKTLIYLAGVEARKMQAAQDNPPKAAPTKSEPAPTSEPVGPLPAGLAAVDTSKLTVV